MPGVEIIVTVVVVLVLGCGIYSVTYSKYYEKKYNRDGASYPIAGWTLAAVIYFWYLYPGYQLLDATFALLALAGGIAYTFDYISVIKRSADVPSADRTRLCLAQILLVPGIVVAPFVLVVCYIIRLVKKEEQNHGYPND